MDSSEFIPFESSKGHYTAEACVFWCFDARFSDAYDAFLAQRGFEKGKIDLVKAAGGAQALALPDVDSGMAGNAPVAPDRSFAKSQIAKSIMLHHADRVILMVHIDCGGYGGSRAFNNDHDAEWKHHAEELARAAEFIKKNFPEVKIVECWIADFDGMHRMQ
jgi:hypothetical protein